MEPHPPRVSSTHKGLALTGPLLSGEVSSFREQGGGKRNERGQLPPGSARRCLWSGGGV